jgi:hypothetical protein
MKKTVFVFILPLLLFACKKDKANTVAGIRQHTLTVDNIIGTTGGNIDAARKGFINFYDGLLYNQAEAGANSSKVDFAYNYHGGGCSTCRFFENVKNMSTRTGYVSGFSTVTTSTIANVAKDAGVTQADFESIRNSNDIENLFTGKSIAPKLFGATDVTNRTTDVATGKVFAFSDKNGKKGLFTINDYTANVPTGNPATLVLTVKVQE